jgi:hypothetical protein
MPRGGKRPGAGAPKGNLNALKTGSRSQQLNTVIEALLASPTIRRVMLKLVQQDVRRNQRLQQAIADAVDSYRRRSISPKTTQQTHKEKIFPKQ